MNGCFVLYPFELGETLTKRINVGVSTDNSFGCELAEDVVCMEDIPPYDVSLRDGWAISTTEGNHTLVGEPVKNGEQPALLQKNGSRWINTGGFLPLAADAVVSDSDPQAPDFAADVYPYENVLPRGTEWTKGSLILKKVRSLAPERRRCCLRPALKTFASGSAPRPRSWRRGTRLLKPAL